MFDTTGLLYIKKLLANGIQMLKNSKQKHKVESKLKTCVCMKSNKTKMLIKTNACSSRINNAFPLQFSVLHKSVAIKIQQKEQPPSTQQMQISDVHLNQTERVRRLIPYMNFYVPINDYLPENQAYSYNPMVSIRR